MTQQLRLIAPATLVALLGACAANPNFTYSPGNDPLVNAYFESYMTRDRVAYRREHNGGYAPLHQRDQSKMVDLGEEAKQIEAGRGSIKVESPCVEEKLYRQLRDAGVIYAKVPQPGSNLLVMTQSDFNAQSVPARFAEYVAECEPWGNDKT